MRVHHIAFRTHSIDRLERFYRELLRLPLVERKKNRSVWLAAADVLLMLEQKAPGEPDVVPGSMDLYAFGIRPQERAELARRFQEAGIAIEAETAYTLYVRDPDGRRVAVSHYPESAEVGTDQP